jgi:hypothetical protein
MRGADGIVALGSTFKVLVMQPEQAIPHARDLWIFQNIRTILE